MFVRPIEFCGRYELPATQSLHLLHCYHSIFIFHAYHQSSLANAMSLSNSIFGSKSAKEGLTN